MNKERYVYVAYSRRSGGASVGIDLFPKGKVCAFNCPYCEVFAPCAPAGEESSVDLDALERELGATLADLQARGVEAEDIAFSGSGEPTQSPAFARALDRAFAVRDAQAPRSAVVLITNGTGLLEERTFALLVAAAARGLDVWCKVDAGTEAWYQAMNHSAVPFSELAAAIASFGKQATFTVQTMRCALREKKPPAEEIAAWEELVVKLVREGGARRVHIYGKARPSPSDPITSRLPAQFLEAYAQALRQKLLRAGLSAPVEVFW